MPKNRVAIPADLARSVRQRCNFACVICRSPFYDYDHIEEYNSVLDHKFDNLVLLCPTCHRKKGRFISKKNIREAREKVSLVSTREELHWNNYSFDIGNNIIKCLPGHAYSIIGFGGFAVGFSDRPLLFAELVDDSGKTVMSIVENMYTQWSNVWDIETKGKEIIFRRGPGKILMRLTVDPEKQLIRVRGNIRLKNNVRLHLTDSGIFLNKILLINKSNISKCNIGLSIKNDLDTRKLFGVKFEHRFGFRSYNGYYGYSRPPIVDMYNQVGNIFGNCECAILYSVEYFDWLVKNPPSENLMSY